MEGAFLEKQKQCKGRQQPSTVCVAESAKKKTKEDSKANVLLLHNLLAVPSVIV
jgi:hypothetical protein